MLAWAAIAAIGVGVLGLFWWTRMHPNPADPNDEWLAATSGLSAAPRVGIRSAVLQGKVVDPGELRPAAVPDARRVRGRGGGPRWWFRGPSSGGPVRDRQPWPQTPAQGA